MLEGSSVLNPEALARFQVLLRGTLECRHYVTVRF